jgi:hypothetical protein
MRPLESLKKVFTESWPSMIRVFERSKTVNRTPSKRTSPR